MKSKKQTISYNQFSMELDRLLVENNMPNKQFRDMLIRFLYELTTVIENEKIQNKS